MADSGTPGPDGRVDPKQLRVSDAEREHVVNLLQRAVGRGMLTLDEFTARSDAALAARTRGELNALVMDLAGLVRVESSAPAPTDRVTLRATMSGVKRQGDWPVPRVLVVRTRVGSTELDFTEARIEHPEVRIELDVTAGSVQLLVPARASVDTDEVRVIAGSVEDHRPMADRQYGVPRFVIVGDIRAGSVEIRQPRYYRLGRLTVRWPWRLSWG